MTIPDPFTQSPFLNTPEVILQQIADAQAIIRFQSEHVARLKDELDQHLHLGVIQDSFIHENLRARRCKRDGKWSYSEFTDEYAKELKGKLEKQMALEREDGIAKQGDPTFYWTVSKK